MAEILKNATIPQISKNHFEEVQNTSNNELNKSTMDPSYTPIIVSVAGGLIFILVVTTVIVWMCKRKYFICTAVMPTKNANQAGVIRAENIEFVLPVPAYTSTDPTEDEVSEQELGRYRYSFIHGAPSGGHQLLAVPPTKRGGIHPDGIAPSLYLSSEGEEERAAWLPPNTNLGKVGFSIVYKSQQHQMSVTILGAMNLPMKRRKHVTHPHVKVTVLPEKYPKFFTKIQKNTPDPVFNEDFLIILKPEDAPNKTLKITMCDFDKFSRRIALGHVFVSLKCLGISPDTNGTIMMGDVWKTLVPRYLDSEEIRGEISLSLCYNPDIRNLRLGIHKVKNLNFSQGDKDISCLYAKVTLFEDTKVIKTRKTSAKRKTLEPDFAETFNIKVTQNDEAHVFCTVAVCSRNKYGARKVIGRTQIGPYSRVSGPGADHWNDAFQSPKSTVTQWHVLH